MLDCSLMQWWRESDGGKSGEGCVIFPKKKKFVFAEPIHCMRMHLQNCRESFLWREDMYLNPRRAPSLAGEQWQGNILTNRMLSN